LVRSRRSKWSRTEFAGRLLRIDYSLSGRSAKQDIKVIQDITSQNAFVTDEIRIELARLLGTVEMNPDEKTKGVRCSAGDTAHYSWEALIRIELHLLAVAPG
jgi:hypothetical protein